MNLYEQQQANRTNTKIVVAVFVLFFALLGFGFDYFYFGYSPWATRVSAGQFRDEEPEPGIPFPSRRSSL